MKIQKEVQEAIKKNLSEEVGNVLRERLDLLDKLEIENKDLKVKVKSADKLCDSYKEQNLKLQKFKADSQKLDVREKALDERDRNFKLELLEVRLEEANTRSQHVVDFTRGLFRNTEVRKHVLGNNNPGGTPMFDSHGTAHYPMPESKDETTTEEEI